MLICIRMARGRGSLRSICRDETCRLCRPCSDGWAGASRSNTRARTGLPFESLSLSHRKSTSWTSTRRKASRYPSICNGCAIEDGATWVILPHDGAHGDKVFATSYESAIREAGFDVLVIPNQGAGAAKARIENC